jgi:hypothetical protein
VCATSRNAGSPLSLGMAPRRLVLPSILAVSLLGACGKDPRPVGIDAVGAPLPDDAALVDAGPLDDGQLTDGLVADVSTPDAAMPDAGVPDAATPDGAVPIDAPIDAPPDAEIG